MMLSRSNKASAILAKRLLLLQQKSAPTTAAGVRCLASVAAANPKTPGNQQQQWSQGLSYTSPESDFTAIHVSANSATMEGEWSQELAAMATPKKNQTTKKASPAVVVQSVSANGATVESEWAEEIWLKDAKEDVKKLQAVLDRQEESSQAILEGLQLACPESALGVVHVSELLSKQEQEQLKGASLGILEEPKDNTLDSSFVEHMMKHRLLNAPESATGSISVTEVLTAKELEQYQALLQKQQQQEEPLPQNMQQALEDTKRAIVITTARPPFKVVNVNDVWEGLCGFSRAEAQHQPIGSLLSGPETNTDKARHVMQRLVQEPAETFDITLINYTKTGRKFYNQLHVGTMKNEQGTPYLVGILHELSSAAEETNSKTQQQMAA